MFGLRTLCCSLLGPGSTRDVCVPERQEVELLMVLVPPSPLLLLSAASFSPLRRLGIRFGHSRSDPISDLTPRSNLLIYSGVFPSHPWQELSAEPRTNVRSVGSTLVVTRLPGEDSNRSKREKNETDHLAHLARCGGTAAFPTSAPLKEDF